MRLGLTPENLRDCERTIIHPDTYEEVKVSDVSAEIVRRADQLSKEDEEFNIISNMKGLVGEIIL